jgi:hypothetical protein
MYIALRVTSLMAAFHTLISDLLRRITMDAEVSLTNLFLTLVVKVVVSWTSLG